MQSKDCLDDFDVVGTCMRMWEQLAALYASFASAVHSDCREVS